MFWIGLATGLFLGAILGFTLCAILIISKQSDEQMEKEARNVKR